MLAYVFLARGTPIVYYGTEQSLTGHQANVLEMLGFASRQSSTEFARLAKLVCC